MVEPKTPESFVVRIWLEGESKDTSTWRGHIQHVQGEEEKYFQNLSEMRAFLEQVSGVPLPATDEAESDG
jgi:hypothetical protein